MSIFIYVISTLIFLALVGNILAMCKLISLDKSFIKAANKIKLSQTEKMQVTAKFLKKFGIENNSEEQTLWKNPLPYYNEIDLSNTGLNTKVKVRGEDGFIKEVSVAEALVNNMDTIDEEDLVDEDKSEFLKEVDNLVPEEVDNSEMFKGF